MVSAVLTLAYGSEVGLRSQTEERYFRVAPVEEKKKLKFVATATGLGLGNREERFVLLNAKVREDRGHVRFGDMVALRSRLAREKCLAANDADDEVGFLRSLVGNAERWEIVPVAGSPKRRGDAVESGDSVGLRSVRTDLFLGVILEDKRYEACLLRDASPWQIFSTGAPFWPSWHDDRPYLAGTFLRHPDRSDDRSDHTAPLERDLVDDVLSALGGYEGGYVHAAVVAEQSPPEQQPSPADDESYYDDDDEENDDVVLVGRQRQKERRRDEQQEKPPMKKKKKQPHFHKRVDVYGFDAIDEDDEERLRERVRFDVSDDVGDLALADLARRCLPVGEAFLRVRSFVRTRSRYEYGRAAHALAAEMRSVLREYLLFVAQLEAKTPRLQELFYWLRKPAKQLRTLDDVAAICGGRKGGALLDVLLKFRSTAADGDDFDLLDALTRAATRPYLETLATWLQTGTLDDPYREFLVVKDDAAGALAEEDDDFNASAWETRFTCDTVHAVGAALKAKAQQVAVTGKYLEVVKDVRLKQGDFDDDDDPETTTTSIYDQQQAASSAWWRTTGPGLGRSRHVVLEGKLRRQQQQPKKQEPRQQRDAFEASYEDLAGDDDGFGALAMELDRAHHEAATALLMLVFRERRADALLWDLKRYFLCGRGDFLLHFADLARADLDKRADEVSPARLESLLRLALALSTEEDEAPPLKVNLARRGLLDHLRAVHAHGVDDELPDSVAADLTAADALELDLHVEWPLSIVVSRKCLVKYQLVFRHLFRTKRLEQRLLAVWTSHMAPKGFYSTMARKKLGRAFLLRNRMLHFVQNLGHYMMSHVIESRHDAMMKKLSTALDIDMALADHEDFLDLVLRECLLTNPALLALLADLTAACDRFANAANRFAMACGLPGDETESALTVLGAHVSKLPRDRQISMRRAHLDRTAAASDAYFDIVQQQSSAFSAVLARFLDRLLAECHLHQHNSHLTDLYNRLHL